MKQAVVEVLFGYSLKQHKSTRRGIIGTVDDLADGIECTGRGSLHAHFLIWLKEVGMMTQLSRDPIVAEAIGVQAAQLVDSITSTDVIAVPDPSITSILERVDPDGKNLSAIGREVPTAEGDQMSLLSTGTAAALPPASIDPTPAGVGAHKRSTTVVNPKSPGGGPERRGRRGASMRPHPYKEAQKPFQFSTPASPVTITPFNAGDHVRVQQSHPRRTFDGKIVAE